MVQYLTQKDLKNKEILKLVERLKASAKTDKEKLVNMLEWQDRNIIFWIERWLPSFILTLSFIICLVVSIFLLIFSPVMKIAWWIIPLSSTVPATILIIILLTLYFNRKIPIKKLPEGLFNILRPSLPIKTVLEYKFAVCRDYAKLTACMLWITYPDKEIYVSKSIDHNATGIRFENKLYLLDQHLPISVIGSAEKWKKFGFETIELLQEGKLKKVKISNVLPLTEKKVNSSLIVETLKNQVFPFLQIETLLVSKPSPNILFECKWRNGVNKYEDNVIVNYSLIRWFNNKMSDAKVLANQISRIEITLEKNDVIFHFIGF